MGCKGSKGANMIHTNDHHLHQGQQDIYFTSVKTFSKLMKRNTADRLLNLNLASCVIDESSSISTALGWRWMSDSLFYCFLQRLQVWTLFGSNDHNALCCPLETSAILFIDTRPRSPDLNISALKSSDLMKLDVETVRKKIALKSIVIFGLSSTDAILDTQSEIFLRYLIRNSLKPATIHVLSGGIEYFSNNKRYRWSLNPHIITNGSKSENEINRVNGNVSIPLSPIKGLYEILPPMTSSSSFVTRCSHQFESFSILMASLESLRNHAEIPQILDSMKIMDVLIVTARLKSDDPFMRLLQETKLRKPERSIHVLSFRSPSSYVSIETLIKGVCIVSACVESGSGGILILDDCDNGPALLSWFFIECGNSFDVAKQQIRRKYFSCEISSQMSQALTFFESQLTQFRTAESIKNARQATLQQTPNDATLSPIQHLSSKGETPSSADFQKTVSDISASNTGGRNGVSDKITDRYLELLSNRISQDDYKECVKVIHVILNNVMMHPSDDKYRVLKINNPKFHKTIGCHPEAVGLLKHCGWVSNTAKDTLELPPSSLLQTVREVLASLPPR